HFFKALQIRPHYEKPHLNLGYVLYEKGQTNEAIKHFLKALQIRPHYEKTHLNLGIVFYHNGNMNRAIKHFQEVIEINPDNTAARNYLKKILILQKQNQ
ncbi:MAG: tetratricopeptide repeat protein, partial [Planctomycetota bacterium]